MSVSAVNIKKSEIALRESLARRRAEWNPNGVRGDEDGRDRVDWASDVAEGEIVGRRPGREF